MKKEYIDKSALVAEIERRISLFQKEKKTEKWSAGASQMNMVSLGARIAMLEEILSFLNILEVKEETEWNEASIKPPFDRTEDGNKYSEPVLCRDNFGNYFIANYVRWRTGYYGWFSGDDEISITHWKELQ